MSIQILCVRTHVGACPAPIQRQLDRFRPELRPFVGALARRHVRLAELSRSFPALLAALARPRAGFDPEPVVESVIAGVPLVEMSRVSAVPMWLRRMPPAMVVAPLPQLPDSTFIAQRIVNHFPAFPHRAPYWFETVSEAGRWVHEAFALWCAQNISQAPRHRGRRRRRAALSFRLLCLWAWYSGQPSARAHALIGTPWNPDMELGAALGAIWDWRETLDLELYLAGRPVEDTWHRPGSARGYDFVPLRSVDDLRVEARAMHNCVRDYGDCVASDLSRLWRVCRDGEHVATLEIGRQALSPIPAIRQLCLKENDDAPPEIWLAAHDWLGAQPPRTLAVPSSVGSAVLPDARVWRSLWKPYWLSRRHIPWWLPLSPNRQTLYDL